MLQAIDHPRHHYHNDDDDNEEDETELLLLPTPDAGHASAHHRRRQTSGPPPPTATTTSSSLPPTHRARLSSTPSFAYNRQGPAWRRLVRGCLKCALKLALLPALADQWTSNVTLFGVLLSSPQVRTIWQEEGKEGGREGRRADFGFTEKCASTKKV
jgi:hypothetical protein